jgi:hypothetical protein
VADVALERLALDRHPLPQWAAFAQMRAGTGYGRGAEQRFDASAFNLWPSKRGYRVVYEMKRTRSDFLRELDRPDKRAQAEDCFHETWFVCARGVCEPEEVPDGWGLLVATKKGDKLRQRKRARPRSPDPIPYAMVCSLLRRVCERIDAQPTFEIEGEDGALSAAELEQLIEERAERRVAPWRAHLREARQAVDREKSQLWAARRELVGPLARLDQLARGGGLPRKPDQLGALTTGDVDRLVEEAAARRARRVIGTISATQQQLSRIVEVLGQPKERAGHG